MCLDVVSRPDEYATVEISPHPMQAVCKMQMARSGVFALIDFFIRRIGCNIEMRQLDVVQTVLTDIATFEKGVFYGIAA